MMSLSVVAVHSRNRQQPVLGFEFNVGIVERALKGAGRGGKRMLVGVENFFLEDFQESHILGVSGFMGANVPADGSAE